MQLEMPGSLTEILSSGGRKQQTVHTQIAIYPPRHIFYMLHLSHLIKQPSLLHTQIAIYPPHHIFYMLHLGHLIKQPSSLPFIIILIFKIWVIFILVTLPLLCLTL
jgi:hypothetical protein